jgi:type IV pilus assembly protein PilE
MINVRKKGFTLIELMVVVAIVALLVALALPSFTDTIRKGRRSDALNSILDLQLAQEKWRVNHTTYGLLGNPSDPLLNLGPDPLISPKGHYSVTVTRPFAAPATSYTITATARNGQENDYCENFVLKITPGEIARTSSKGEDDLCWRK